MNENETIAYLQKLRAQLENKLDELRTTLWLEWQKMDKMIENEITRIEEERQMMANNMGGK